MSFLSSPRSAARVPLGDSHAISSGEAGALQRQINRYTLEGGAPVQLRVGAAPLAVTDVIDVETATRALWIMQMRAGMAHIQWNDGASKELLDEAMKAWGSPVPFVQSHLSRVSQIVKLFADKNGIPPPKGIFPGMSPTLIVGALTVGALLFIFRKGVR